LNIFFTVKVRILDKGFTVWFTGKHNSGETTLANHLTKSLIQRGLAVELFDGETLRRELWPELGYTKDDWCKSVHRIAYFCHLFNRNGITCAVASTSPYNEHREAARKILDNYIEIYVQASASSLHSRDGEGFYATAEADKIVNFTGVNDLYEEPLNPDLTLNTDAVDENDCLQLILQTLEEMCFIERTSGDYSEEEKSEIDKRLRSLGYL